MPEHDPVEMKETNIPFGRGGMSKREEKKLPLRTAQAHNRKTIGKFDAAITESTNGKPSRREKSWRACRRGASKKSPPRDCGRDCNTLHPSPHVYSHHNKTAENAVVLTGGGSQRRAPSRTRHETYTVTVNCPRASPFHSPFVPREPTVLKAGVSSSCRV